MQNIIKIHAWAEPYVNFLLGETSPLSLFGNPVIPDQLTSDKAS